jgi:nitroreductase
MTFLKKRACTKKEKSVNEVIRTIEERRSVRNFESKPIPKNFMQQIIDAGNRAPSGMNARAWRFVVVADKAAKQKLVDWTMPRYKKWFEQLSAPMKAKREEVERRMTDPIYYSAPAIVFVIGTGMTAPFDCPMVCQNMMLAARSLGIGSCWVFIGQLASDEPEMRGMLELKDGEKIYGPIVLGYPKGDFPVPPQINSAVVKWI